MTTCVLTEVFALPPLPYLTRDIAATLKRKPADVVQVSGTEPTELYLPAVCFLTDSPVENCPPTGPLTNRRMFLTRLYYQLGEWLDYYTEADD